MLGNWAMGSLAAATRPMMTMSIAITMATMGRLMKNLDMAGYLFSAGCAAGFVSGPAVAGGAAAGFASAPAGAAGAPLAPGTYSFGATVIPGLTFWVPSTTTFSPSLSPSSMIQSEPTRSPTLTGLMSTL